MNRIITIDLKDYNDSMPRFIRPSVRGVIINGTKIAMVYSSKYDYYKFPGGGLEKDESHVQALIREIKEETGLTVIPESISEIGSVLRIQRSLINDNEIFEQENYYYKCSVESSIDNQSLDQYELDEGFCLKFVLPQTAINVNRNHNHKGYDKMLIEREALVLDYLINKRIL